MRRGQVPLTVLEATLGLLLLVSLTLTFALGVPDSGGEQVQLDAYASDAATILAGESPRHADQSRLSELVASADTFQREKAALERRVGRLLPPNLMFRVETEYGTAGHRLPEDVPTGSATVTTVNGDVTIRVWYV